MLARTRSRNSDRDWDITRRRDLIVATIRLVVTSSRAIYEASEETTALDLILIKPLAVASYLASSVLWLYIKSPVHNAPSQRIALPLRFFPLLPQLSVLGTPIFES